MELLPEQVHRYFGESFIGADGYSSVIGVQNLKKTEKSFLSELQLSAEKSEFRWYHGLFVRPKRLLKADFLFSFEYL